MRQVLWKRLLSYITELHIESTSSEYNPNLYVSLRDGRYQLCTANAIYSFEDRYDNFTEAFKQIDLNQLPGKKVLILGFGMASVPIILEKLGKIYHYTGIEIDQKVISLAQKYALDGMRSKFNLICADALLFTMQCQEQFDLVIMDVFFDDLIPKQFETSAFLNRLKAITKPEGLLMYNRLAYNDRDITSSTAFYEDIFSEVFPDGTYLEVKGNWMLLNNRKSIKGKS